MVDDLDEFNGRACANSTLYKSRESVIFRLSDIQIPPINQGEADDKLLWQFFVTDKQSDCAPSAVNYEIWVSRSKVQEIVKVDLSARDFIEVDIRIAITPLKRMPG